MQHCCSEMRACDTEHPKELPVDDGGAEGKKDPPILSRVPSNSNRAMLRRDNGNGRSSCQLSVHNDRLVVMARVR